MKKTLLSILIVAVSVTLLPFRVPEAFAARRARALPTAKTALVVDREAGEVLFSRSPQTRRSPASTVKLLTALVVLDVLPLDAVVRIHPAVAGTQPSHIGLHGNESFYVRDLLKALLVESANDAARALAIAVSGSEYQFIRRMNEKAKTLGARRSNFLTPNGLPAKGQYSTAYDLIQIMRAAEKSSFIMNTLAIKETTIRSLEGRSVHIKNHNKMLWKGSREIIGKTGWTRQARHCFVGVIRNNGKAVYVALMGSSKKWSDLSYFANRFVGQTNQLVSSGNAKMRSVGSRGEDVRKIQEALQRAGFFRQTPTGYFGPVTKRAVVQFQRAHHLSQDGVVGSQTRTALNQY